jgi:hypothetical protein
MKSKLYRFLSAFLFQYFRSINNLNYFSVYLKIKIDSNYARETNRKVKYNNINNELKTFMTQFSKSTDIFPTKISKLLIMRIFNFLDLVLFPLMNAKIQI